ncbi:GNAT family N-acetyltransferase [Halorussus litoreus]|uniref:GNAT family N-acetyltransferase n=1 Tax=Halorussus litoreus TaxID=1710536 RepID=UPI000E2666C3|nr:GNAT family N-acetyltransferase [Halorussus litoreus]
MTTTPAAPSTNVRVRQAVQADLLAVLRIERASFSQPWPFAAFDRYLGEPGFLVATVDTASTDGDAYRFDESGHGAAESTEGADESVVGFAVADLVPNHGRAFGHVKDIAVHPDHRGEGVGARLLERALAVLAVGGARSVKLEVRESNDPALSLYRDFGFQHLRTVSRYYDDGEDALILVVDLDA